MKDPLYRPNWEAIDQPLYDRQVYPAWHECSACQSLRFFQHPVGAFDGVKTYVDTNMELSSVLPSGKEFLVRGIGVTMPDADETERMRLYWGGVVTLILATRVYVRRPLIAFAETNTISVEKSPLLITQGFRLDIDWPAPIVVLKNVRICVELIGLMYRKTN